MKHKLLRLYDMLYAHFGPQGWWPAETRFEMTVGAILTQNTAWSNVEKAIAGLKRARRLTPQKMRSAGRRRIARLIRPAGYYNIKAERLIAFLDYFLGVYKGDFGRMFSHPWPRLRRELLSVKGIGPETADSILLYAGGRPVFVVDAYTKRVLSRHRMIRDPAGYEEVQGLFMSSLPKRSALFNEYHALFVKLCKEYCRKRPDCASCPASGL